MQRVWEFRSRVLGGALEPFDALLGPLRQAQLAVEFSESEAVQRTGVGRSSGFAVKLYRFRRLTPAAPAVLTACPSSVRGIRVAVLGGEDKKGEGAVKVLAVLVGPNAIRVAVGEKILRGHVPAVCIALEERSGLLYKIFPLFDSLFDVHDVARGEFGDGKRLGGIDHEDGKLELEVWVLSLFGIRAVQLECSFVG